MTVSATASLARPRQVVKERGLGRAELAGNACRGKEGDGVRVSCGHTRNNPAHRAGFHWNQQHQQHGRGCLCVAAAAAAVMTVLPPGASMPVSVIAKSL